MSANIANAQGVSITFTGKADLSFPDDYTMVVTCTEEETCAQITGGSDGHLRLLIPDHRLDLVLMSSKIEYRLPDFRSYPNLLFLCYKAGSAKIISMLSSSSDLSH